MKTEIKVIKKEVRYINLTDFEKWLHDTGVYLAFITNLLTLSKMTMSEWWDIVSKQSPALLMYKGFLWEKSIQGDSFWRTINSQFEKYIEKNNIIGYEKNTRDAD